MYGSLSNLELSCKLETEEYFERLVEKFNGRDFPDEPLFKCLDSIIEERIPSYGKKFLGSHSIGNGYFGTLLENFDTIKKMWKFLSPPEMYVYNKKITLNENSPTGFNFDPVSVKKFTGEIADQGFKPLEGSREVPYIVLKNKDEEKTFDITEILLPQRRQNDSVRSLELDDWSERYRYSEQLCKVDNIYRIALKFGLDPTRMEVVVQKSTTK